MMVLGEDTSTEIVSFHLAIQHSSPGKTLSLVGSLERDAKLEAK